MSKCSSRTAWRKVGTWSEAIYPVLDVHVLVCVYDGVTLLFMYMYTYLTFDVYIYMVSAMPSVVCCPLLEVVGAASPLHTAHNRGVARGH